jgi:hypothetical protein
MNYLISIISGAFLAMVMGRRCFYTLPLPPDIDRPRPPIPPPPCPPIIWKDVLTMLAGGLGAFLYIMLMKVNPTFTSLDFIAANIAAVALGGLFRMGFCPLK